MRLMELLNDKSKYSRVGVVTMVLAMLLIRAGILIRYRQL
jgi:hypothetical protein